MTEPLIGVRAAAQALGKNASTISRYLASHPELNHAEAGAPKVRLSELRAHRGETVNQVMAGNHAGQLFGEDEAAAADLPPDDHGRERRSRPSAPSAGGKAPGYAHAKTARETILAREAQLRLEEKLGSVVSRRLVEDAATEAGQALREGLGARNRDLAHRFAALTDPLEIKAALDEADCALLERIADALDRRLGGEEEQAQ